MDTVIFNNCETTEERLKLAIEMLDAIETGGSYSIGAWTKNMMIVKGIK